MATYTFTLRSGGDPLVDARITYAGGVYDIDSELTAGSGTITTTDDTLAQALRLVYRSDNLLLLVEGGSSPGGTAPDHGGSVPAFIQADEPTNSVYLWVQIERDDSGDPILDVDGNVNITDIKVRLG